MDKWKIGNKCFIMTKEGKALRCTINRPYIFIKSWVLYDKSNSYYWGVGWEDKMFKTKKECLQATYGGNL